MDESRETDSLQPETGLQRVLDQVESITAKLVQLALYAVGSTAASVVCAILLSIIPRLVPEPHTATITFILLGLLFSCIAIFTVILFSFVKNKGDTLFKEASDELQWYVRYGNHDIVSMPYVSAAPAAPERPQIRTRIVLREYARATVLPLLSSSEYGVAIYIGVNIMLLISYPVLSRFAMLK